MAFIECSYYSEILGITTNINVCLPQDTFNKRGGYSIPEEGLPTLYLLHGLGDDHTIWSRKCAIDRYAAIHGIAVVMPYAEKSFYCDKVYGLPYYSYISDELITTAESFFPISKDPNKRFIGGLSMGGYGAFKIALSNPTKFRAAFSLSGCLDIAHIKAPPAYDFLFKDLELVCGDLRALDELPYNLFKLAAKVSDTPIKPSLFMCCGTEDTLYEANQRFKNHIQLLDYDLTYDEGPGGHDFNFWEPEVIFAFKWLSKHLNDK